MSQTIKRGLTILRRRSWGPWVADSRERFRQLAETKELAVIDDSVAPVQDAGLLIRNHDGAASLRTAMIDYGIRFSFCRRGDSL